MINPNQSQQPVNNESIGLQSTAPADAFGKEPSSRYNNRLHSMLKIAATSFVIGATGGFVSGENGLHITSLRHDVMQTLLNNRPDCKSNFKDQQDSLLESLSNGESINPQVAFGRTEVTHKMSAAEVKSMDQISAIRDPIRLVCKYDESRVRFIAIDDAALGINMVIDEKDTAEPVDTISPNSYLVIEHLRLHYSAENNADDGLVDHNGRPHAYAIFD
jgi:hypothetical protein